MKKILVVGLVIALMVTFTGCEIKYRSDVKFETDAGEGDWGERIGDSFQLEEEIDSLELVLQFGVGELRVTGGAENSVDAAFDYNREGWKPEIKKEIDGKEGYLKIQQPSIKDGFNLVGDIFESGKTRNSWNIKVKDGMKLKLDMDGGVGDSRLDLTTVQLDGVSLDCGVGNVTADMSGNYEEKVDVIVNGGVGELTLYVSKDMGVKVDVDKGIGDLDIDGFIKYGDEYTNRAYDENKSYLNINVDMGVGSIHIIEQ